MKRAWLIVWEGTPHALGDRNRVVAILDSRLSGKRVRDYVEFFYVASEYAPNEKVLWAKGKFNPYPAEFLKVEGVPWHGCVNCGSNPWLEARQVSNIRITIGKHGEEQLLWDETQSEQIKQVKEAIKSVP